MLVWHRQSWRGNGHTGHTAFSTRTWECRARGIVQVIVMFKCIIMSCSENAQLAQVNEQ